MAHGELELWPLIPPDGLAVPLDARTRDAVIRRLVALAERNELVYSRDVLIDEIRRREELCSTALAPGVAVPHPHRPVPYDIGESFVVVGLTASGIPFGAEDGSLTRLFFLACCKDDRTHLHVLARLARMLYDRGAIERMLAASDEKQLGEVLLQRERAVIGDVEP
jgi:PTS system nitrogen regulatory IIA component